jgi:heme exporter protein CcmD
MTSSSFWAMGGYARYVWPCFGFSCAVLAWNIWSARRVRAAAYLRARRGAEMAAMDKS